MAPWWHRPQYAAVDRKPNGVFIVDSFGMTGVGRNWMRTYMPSALEYVYWTTGMLCLAAQCGEGYEGDGYAELFDGAKMLVDTMYDDTFRKKVYAGGEVMVDNMYDDTFRKYEDKKVYAGGEMMLDNRYAAGDSSHSAYADMFCVIISMGKDVYKLAKDKPRVYKDDEAIATIATGMQDVCRYCQAFLDRECLVVYGGTQEVWGYEQKFGEIYDEYVDAVVKKLRDGGTNVIKGIHLGQLQTVDRIGHVHVKSLEAVFNMYALWARIAGGRPWTDRPRTSYPYPRTSYPRSKL